MNKTFGVCSKKGWSGVKYADKEEDDALDMM
jgi:hypothetical protein